MQWDNVIIMEAVRHFRERLMRVFTDIPVELCAVSNHILLSRIALRSTRSFAMNALVQQAIRQQIDWNIVLGTDDPLLFDFHLAPTGLPSDVQPVNENDGAFTKLRAYLANRGYGALGSEVVRRWATAWPEACFCQRAASGGNGGASGDKARHKHRRKSKSGGSHKHQSARQ